MDEQALSTQLCMAAWRPSPHWGSTGLRVALPLVPVLASALTARQDVLNSSAAHNACMHPHPDRLVASWSAMRVTRKPAAHRKGAQGKAPLRRAPISMMAAPSRCTKPADTMTAWRDVRPSSSAQPSLLSSALCSHRLLRACCRARRPASACPGCLLCHSAQAPVGRRHLQPAW